VQIFIAVTGRLQPRGHALRGQRAIACGKRCVGLDQLLINRPNRSCDWSSAPACPVATTINIASAATANLFAGLI